jgi:hypothetical protein
VAHDGPPPLPTRQRTVDYRRWRRQQRPSLATVKGLAARLGRRSGAEAARVLGLTQE